MAQQELPYTQDDVLTANRSVNIAYIMAGCLSLACEDMQEYLKKVRSDLKYSNKRQIGIVLELTKRLIKQIDQLEGMSILNCDDDSIYMHDCAQFNYYTILLRCIQVLGADNLTDLRALYLYNHIKRFEDLINLPKIDIREQQAFMGISKKIAHGDFSNDELYTCLKLKDYESEHKTHNCKD